MINKTNIKQRLRRPFSALAIIGALTVGALFALPTAQAGRQINATGSWTAHQYVTSCEASANGIYEIDTYNYRATFTGTLEGTFEGIEVDVNYPSIGYFTGFGEGTFTGCVAGNNNCGTVHMTYLAAGSPPGFIAQMWMVDSGTDGLEGLVGQGIWPNVHLIIPPEPNPDCPNGPTLDFAGKVSGQLQFAQ